MRQSSDDPKPFTGRLSMADDKVAGLIRAPVLHRFSDQPCDVGIGLADRLSDAIPPLTELMVSFNLRGDLKLQAIG
jgi:hypothetical protein